MSWRDTSPPPLRREAHFGDRVVSCFADRPASLFALLDEAVARRPGGEAIVCDDVRWTYAALDGAVGRMAAGFVAAGVVAGDRVGLLVGQSGMGKSTFLNLLGPDAHARTQ